MTHSFENLRETLPNECRYRYAKREYIRGQGKVDEKGAQVGSPSVFSRVASLRIPGRRSLTSESPRRRGYPSHISPRDVLRISHPRSAFRCRYACG